MAGEEKRDFGLERQIIADRKLAFPSSGGNKLKEEANCALVEMDPKKCSTYLTKGYCPPSCGYFYRGL